ncbi:hypothetical protein Goari_014416, partial [Gossypium aridum]|nr:hypothetical protein [Gossypium aridum]
MPWFRHHGKQYLLLEEVRGRQHHTIRPRRALNNPKSGATVKAGPLSAP